MTEVFVATHPTEAHLMAGLLGSHGIATEIRGEPLFGVRGDIPPSPATLPTVWVEDADAETARAIIADRAPAKGEHESWICPACSEAVEGQFAVCWNCGAPRPAAAE